MGARGGTDTARGLVELTRPGNALAAGLLTFVGAFVAGGATARLGAAVLAVAATVLATAGGNAVNDYFDRDIDRINAPRRPIPRGAVAPRNALGFSVALFAGAAACALLLPLPAVTIAAVNLAALVVYTELFKGLPAVGNAVVSYLGGSTFLFGAAAVEGLGPAAWVLFALAALSTFAREVVKDVEDLAGDRAEGLRTLPIVVGERGALLAAGVSLAAAVAASPAPYTMGALGVAYLVVVVPADAVMAYAAARSVDDPTTGQRWLKRGMFLAAAAFVVGRAATLV
jgi:geranylgeranylglycerol-phosphate geranylgeranyltransferase